MVFRNTIFENRKFANMVYSIVGSEESRIWPRECRRCAIRSLQSAGPTPKFRRAARRSTIARLQASAPECQAGEGDAAAFDDEDLYDRDGLPR